MGFADIAEVSVTIESSYSGAATRLIENLSAELSARYGDDGAGAFNSNDVQVPGGVFVVAWLGERPVGCGALRPFERGVAEVKRMFVEKDVRRQGIARKILERLEALATQFATGPCASRQVSCSRRRSICTSLLGIGASVATGGTSITR